MVACAALSSLQPPNHLAVSMIACAQTVDDIKKRLQIAAENDDQTLCESLLNEVRPLVTTREILEETRIGFVVNQLRRQYFKKWPSLLRISREVIKSWSEIVCDEVKRPQSGASSRNTTPNVLSPSVAKLMQRGITPNTPVGRRVTSTGLPGSQQRLVSPANGSYAPRSQVSPGDANSVAATIITNGMHKSASLGGDLLKHSTESLSTKPITPKENGKRKAVDEGVLPSIKRTKTAAGALSVGITPGTPSTISPHTPTMSVSAARKLNQSTSELFAQMNQTLPGHIDIGTDIKEHEERFKRETKDEELAHSLHSSASYGNFGSTHTTERKKRKYERKNQKANGPSTPAAVASPMLQTPTTATPPLSEFRI
uniref:TFIIS N-terminal domain-containing protein n=1 Tax=Caenorhabditis tropicalis TaxID=1561998 RepID=A0A1I7TSK8_9PELO